MRRYAFPVVLSIVLSVALFAQTPAPMDPSSDGPKRPLTELPYSPGLDLTSLDRSADPCVDFYQFACGGWKTQNPIPSDQPRWSVYRKLQDANQQFLWGLLERAAEPRGDRSPAEQKIGDYFAACMDEPAIETRGDAPLLEVLKAIDALRSPADLPEYIGRQQLESGVAFGFGSNQDLGDSTQVIAFLDAGGLGLPDRDYYVKTDADSVALRQKYVHHVARMFSLLGHPTAQASAEANTVMAFETALARASLTNVERRDPYKLFHKLDRKALDALTPGFAWGPFLAAQGVPDLQVFNVTEPTFFKTFASMAATRPLSAWKTYLTWHVMHDRAATLPKRFDDATFQFFGKTLRGIAEQPPRWKRCVRYVDRDLGEALGRVFVDKAFAPETKAKVLDMTHFVEGAMASEIDSLDWMSDATKARAREKLSVIVNKIAYPDRWRDYSALEIRRDDFFGDVTRSAVFEAKRQLAKIGKPVDRGEWGITPPTVDAEYTPQLNAMTFPAGVLQPPLFDPKMDEAPNYGNTGATIGHELTHGFDDEGRQFDAQGNLKDWWTAEDAARFNERLKCVQDQYAQYVVVDDIHITSTLTSGEDVADLGGTWLAYLAWRKATEAQRLQPIDGFAPDQRFFIGMGQWACENTRPEDERLMAATNPHSPGRYRINGVVANLPVFAKAFSCRKGQPMARETACKVW